VSLHYAWATQQAGRFSLRSTATIWNSDLIQETPLQPYYDYVGTASGGGSSSQGTIPRWKTYTVLDWSSGAIEATIGHTYIPTVEDIGPGGAFATSPVGVSSYQQFDAILGYDFSNGSAHWLRKLKVRAGVNNLSDEKPPVAYSAFPSTNADVGDYGGPIGRLFFVDATFKY
jgi:iron complex outermembrane receptor protein